MHKRKYRGGNWPNQYSQEHHLGRAVQCVDCGGTLHKTHNYVFYGNRCRPCYQAMLAAGAGGAGNTSSGR